MFDIKQVGLFLMLNMYLGLSISEKKIFRGTAEQTEIMNFAEKKMLGIPRQRKTLGILV
jgi:hypothetical protein